MLQNKQVPLLKKGKSEKVKKMLEIIAKCSTSKARVSRIHLTHQTVDAPVFMPVGTQGTMKGILTHQLKEMNCQIMLGNTYHLGHRPGPEILESSKGLHNFMHWDRALLTDSGGFQMVSLLKLAQITEEGVEFASPHDGSRMLLTPEKSIELQNAIGADIIMQLDDVVHTLTTGERVREAMLRSVRWLDRCIEAHKRKDEQKLFAIIQGGLNMELRAECIEEMVKRDLPGYAIGGLSGGEDKNMFWKTVSFCTQRLPSDKPVYCMGVGYAIDLVVCVALGVDMFDCVFPTRTARFGNALVPWGSVPLKQQKYEADTSPIDPDCSCYTCQHYSRAYLRTLIGKETIGCHLVTIHNLYYQLNLMRQVRESIMQDRFPAFVQGFVSKMYALNVPDWVSDAFSSVGIHLNKDT